MVNMARKVKSVLCQLNINNIHLVKLKTLIDIDSLYGKGKITSPRRKIFTLRQSSILEAVRYSSPN